jgi:REP element-mobilizing transposase RayT
LGQIVAYFKYQSTKHINLARVLPGVSVWHRNYYEHIIRNELGLHNVRHYIANNPAQWSLDNENPARTK